MIKKCENSQQRKKQSIRIPVEIRGGSSPTRISGFAILCYDADYPLSWEEKHQFTCRLPFLGESPGLPRGEGGDKDRSA